MIWKLQFGKHSNYQIKIRVKRVFSGKQVSHIKEPFSSELKSPPWVMQSKPRLREEEESSAETEDIFYHFEWPHLSSGGSIFLLALEQKRRSTLKKDTWLLKQVRDRLSLLCFPQEAESIQKAVLWNSKFNVRDRTSNATVCYCNPRGAAGRDTSTGSFFLMSHKWV